ncbi:MAG: hypothetical protein ACI9SQ_001352, partial [Rubritalea sp.]
MNFTKYTLIAPWLPTLLRLVASLAAVATMLPLTAFADLNPKPDPDRLNQESNPTKIQIIRINEAFILNLTRISIVRMNICYAVRLPTPPPACLAPLANRP